MGHRALVGYRRVDHLYDLRYSHWGGVDPQLAQAITPETPLADGRVDGTVLADTVALERLLTGFLDPRVHEALYLVSPAFEVTPYRVWWLDWSDGRESCRGAIVETRPDSRVRDLRTWFRATKAVLADAIEMGVLSRRAARAYLEARICEEQGGYVYTYGEADGVGGARSGGDDRPPPGDGGSSQSGGGDSSQSADEGESQSGRRRP